MIIFASFVSADDWTRFRGPSGNGVSAAPAVTEWSPEKNIKWKVPLPGAGVSSPVIVGNKIFLTTYTGYGLTRQEPGDQKELKRHVVCLDRKTGKELWKKTIAHEGPEDKYTGMGVPEHGYASHTPVTDGKHLFVFLGKGGVRAYDLDGEEVWKQSVGTGSDDRQWGSASSPILYKNILIVPAVAEDVAMYGLDTATGNVVWKSEADGLRSSWSTPLIVTKDNQSDLVMGVPSELWGMNPENGKLRWMCTDIGGESFCTSAISKDGVIYASVGGRMGGGTIAVKGGGKRDVTASHVIWKSNVRGSFCSPVMHKDQMFVFSRGVVTVVNAVSGETVKEERLPSASGGGGRGGMSSDYASPFVAGDSLYYLKRNGDMHVFTADAELKPISVNKVTRDSEDFSASPAVLDGQIFIRSNKHLYCVEKD